MARVKVPEQKVILVGDYGVGKSSLFRRFATNHFTTATDRQSTLGLDYFAKEYTTMDKTIKIQLWDTGGMERVASVTSSYYKFAETAILVFAWDNISSFHNLSQHLLDIVTYAENAKIFLCGNKSDLDDKEVQVSNTDIESFIEQCGESLISGVFRTSCKRGDGIDEMFRYIASTLVQTNRSKMELQSFKINTFRDTNDADPEDSSCICW